VYLCTGNCSDPLWNVKLDDTKLSSSKLILRPAQPSDTRKVLAFLEDVWEGGDYLPSVWDEWLEDPSGQVIVAELAGEPIGTGRIVDLGWGEFWLEGLRVAKDNRGMGVASRIQEHVLSIWEKRLGSTIGYLTHRDQTAMHKLARRGGFRERFRVQMIRWGSAEGEHDFEICEDLSLTSDNLHAWSLENGLDGRMEVAWTYPKIIPERVRGFERIYSWRHGRAFVVLNIDEWDDQEIAALICAQFEAEDLRELFLDLGRLCSMLGAVGGRWFAPSSLNAAFDRAGVGVELVKDLEMVCYMRSV
jgi:GNAT superfamily N-acetyltransferase